jgi:hypothetical protein
MRGVGVLAGAAAAAVTGCLGAAPSAHASDYGVELNGTYRVISDGEWAKRNEVFIDEKTVIETWTMSSTCTSPIRCTGQVTSDQGWTAPMGFDGGYWRLDRVIENWEPCPASYDYPGARIFTGAEGTAASGTQRFFFWGWDVANNGIDHTNVKLLAGRHRTQGPSGACGINKPLVIELPMRLEKLS